MHLAGGESRVPHGASQGHSAAPRDSEHGRWRSMDREALQGALAYLQRGCRRAKTVEAVHEMHAGLQARLGCPMTVEGAVEGLEGDTVELRRGSPSRQLWDRPAQVYGSLLFTRSRPLGEQLRALYPDAILGGTGWEVTVTLGQVGIPETGPLDYSMYPGYPHSVGF